MHARRREYIHLPNEVIGDEQMRTTAPAIVIAKKCFKIPNAGYAGDQTSGTVAIGRLDPLRERRCRGVVPNDFRWAPFIPLQVSDPAPESLLRVFCVD